jgi:hypothetical protein
LANCRYNAKYWDYDLKAEVDFNCDKDEDILSSGLCIFHDEHYLQDSDNRDQHEAKVRQKLMDRVRHSISQKEPLLLSRNSKEDERQERKFITSN